MTARTLICTFGFARQKVLAAMRLTAYNRLVIVAGSDVLEHDDLRSLVELESSGGGMVETVAVDPFDFADCMRKVDETIRSSLKIGEVMMNISGGTKVLCDAAILAAFQNGVETYHCEGKVVKLPVIKGIRFEDKFNAGDRSVLRHLEDGDTMKELTNKMGGEEVKESTLRNSVRHLQALGVLQAKLERGQARYYWAHGHRK